MNVYCVTCRLFAVCIGSNWTESPRTLLSRCSNRILYTKLFGWVVTFRICRVQSCTLNKSFVFEKDCLDFVFENSKSKKSVSGSIDCWKPDNCYCLSRCFVMFCTCVKCSLVFVVDLGFGCESIDRLSVEGCSTSNVGDCFYPQSGAEWSLWIAWSEALQPDWTHALR